MRFLSPWQEISWSTVDDESSLLLVARFIGAGILPFGGRCLLSGVHISCQAMGPSIGYLPFQPIGAWVSGCPLNHQSSLIFFSTAVTLATSQWIFLLIFTFMIFSSAYSWDLCWELFLVFYPMAYSWFIVYWIKNNILKIYWSKLYYLLFLNFSAVEFQELQNYIRIRILSPLQSRIGHLIWTSVFSSYRLALGHKRPEKPEESRGDWLPCDLVNGYVLASLIS